MIVISLLLILVAVTLLVLGLTSGSSLLLISSIVASLLAAVALVVGARQANAGRAELVNTEFDRTGEVLDDADEVSRRDAAGDDFPAEDYPDRYHDPEEEYSGYEGRRQRHGASPPVSTEFRDEAYQPAPGYSPAAGYAPDAGYSPDIAYADDDYADRPVSPAAPAAPPHQRDPEPDPEDEPGAQHVTAADTARVARMTADVYVVDGRPRYHLAGCVHLMDKEAEPLPVNEAVELGFTPCGLCEPDSALLADARRV